MEKIWKNDLTDEVLALLSGQTLERARSIIKEFDSKTFFQTARLIIKNTRSVEFKKDIPYVLIINDKDETVDIERIKSLFEREIPKSNLLTIYTTIEHYPKDISKKYFQHNIPKTEIEKISDWIT